MDEEQNNLEASWGATPRCYDEHFTFIYYGYFSFINLNIFSMNLVMLQRTQKDDSSSIRHTFWKH